MTLERILITDAAPADVLRALDEALTAPHRTLADRVVFGDNEALVEVYRHDYESTETVPYDRFPTAVDAFSPKRGPGDDEARSRGNDLVAFVATLLHARGIAHCVVEDLDRVVD